MTTEESLNQSIDKMVKRYSSLFTLPSYKMVLLMQGVCCIGGILFLTIVVYLTPDGLYSGLLFGLSFFSVSLILNYAVSMVVLRHDQIYDMRRTSFLTLFGWLIWLPFTLLGATLTGALGFELFVMFTLLGFSASLVFRFIVFHCTSSSGFTELSVASAIHPLICMILFAPFWSSLGFYMTPNFLLLVVLSTIVSSLCGLAFLHILNQTGRRTLGVDSVSLFKAFLLNWILDLNTPFDDLLEKLAEKRTVDVSLLRFGNSTSKAIIAVPSVHPGPFKNVGSSLLPSKLKAALEAEFDCIACVPHGLLGHELDLASQKQMNRLIDKVLEDAEFNISELKATPLVKAKNDLATVCCQIFGRLSVLTFSLAPSTTEDLPQELGLFVNKELKKYDLEGCVVINAHNSINGSVTDKQVVDALRRAAAEGLRHATKLNRQRFKVGAASVRPEGLGPREGMGPGGLTVVTVEVGAHRNAYVVIDGNNMVSGLRERILSELRDLGISDGEVLTTDTHSVNALVLSGRGYHPIGEVINHEELVEYIRRATMASLSDLEATEASGRTIEIPDTKVIGEERLEALCLLTDAVLKRARKAVVPLFASMGAFLTLLFTVL